MLQQLFNGLAIGGIYILMALGLTMIYGVLRVLHFAHGLVVAVGAYLGWRVLSVHHLPFGVALLAAMAGGAITGALIERLAYRPLGAAPPLAVLIAGVGTSIMGEDLLRHIAQPERRPVPAPTAAIFHLGPLTISGVQALVLSITIALLLAVGALINYTRVGLSIRATAADREASRLMGIDVDRVASVTFGVGSGLAGAAGLLVALAFNAFYPGMGAMASGKAFAVVVMGGLGSVAGTVFAGLFLGVTEAIAVGYLNLPLERDAIAFLALICLLVIRPTGIIGAGPDEAART